MRLLSCARREPIHRLAFSADGRYLAANQGTMYHRGLEVFDLEQPEAPARVLKVAPATPVFRFLPDHPTLVYGDNYLYGFDLRDAEPTARPIIPETIYPIGAFDFSEDGRQVLVTRLKPYTIVGKSGYHLWRLEPDGSASEIWERSLGSDLDTIENATAFVAGGQFATVEKTFNRSRNAYDFQILLRDTATGKSRTEIPPPVEGTLLQLVGHAATGRLAVRYENAIAVWSNVSGDARSNHRLAEMPSTCIVFHPSGQHLAASAADGTVSLLDPESLAVTRSYNWEVGPLRSIAICPNGTLGAAGSADGKIVVWDADS